MFLLAFILIESSILWSMFTFNMQRDHSRKRLESNHFESNGTSGKLHFHVTIVWLIGARIHQQSCFLPYIITVFSVGLYVQHSAKKPKILKQPVENTFDNITTMTGSIPSPVASQNNMSNTSKFIKLIGGRDRGRKAKSLKVFFNIAHVEVCHCLLFIL